MVKKSKIILSLCLISLCIFINACYAIKTTNVENDYYKMKSIFLVVAEEAYEYTTLEQTPIEEKLLIKEIGLSSFKVIENVDKGIEKVDVALSKLVEYTKLLQEVMNKNKQE